MQRFSLIFLLPLFIASAHADIEKGQKLYIKKLKPVCKMTGSDFAAKYSQDEWEEIYNTGKFNSKLNAICGTTLEEKLLPHIYDFAYEYANDSGNVPNC